MLLNKSKKCLFSKSNHTIFISFFLIITTLAVYWQVNEFEFVGLDDALYVADNPHIKEGLSYQNIKWAFTDATEITNYWAPLTWISIIIDYKLYEMNAGGYHRTNLIFHILNSILILLVFNKMTGKRWHSAFIAVMFAIHPLHVESVAWMTERKDVLSTFFWMLTMWFYASYVILPGTGRYLLVIIFFFLGIMAKPMLVTLPFALLLLDFWPLSRLEPSLSVSALKKTFLLLLEKVPLFIIIFIASLSAFFFQEKGGVLPSLELIPFYLRIENILVSYTGYLLKTIWPFGLSAIYPYPNNIPNWQVIISFTILSSISLISIRTIKKAPWFTFGWFWYLGILVPVIGIVVIGPHAMADRYTYIPLIGIFIIISWGIPELITQLKFRTAYLGISVCLLSLILLLITWIQVGYWRTSYTLFKHALEVTEKNPLAHDGMANAFAKRGQVEESIKHYKKSILQYPYSAEVHSNLGVALFKQGKIKEAIKHYNTAIQLKPDFITAWNNLGNALKKIGQFEEATACFTKLIKLEPNSAVINYNYGSLLLEKNQLKEAEIYFKKAIQLDPSFTADANNNLGKIYMRMNEIEKAVLSFLQALQDNPDQAKTHYYLGDAYSKAGKLDEAMKHFSEAVTIEPDFINARVAFKQVSDLNKQFNELVKTMEKEIKGDPKNPNLFFQLGKLYEQTKNFDQAIIAYQNSIEIQPDFIPALNKMGILYATQNNYKYAIDTFKKIVSIKPEMNSTYYNIACLYSKQNDTKEAIDWLTQAIEKGYDNYDQITTDKDLDNIRKTRTFHMLVDQLRPVNN
jgi:protein O-mannosyl-transferase